MNTVYELIQQNPEYFAWVFGVVNVLWGLFAYFNKQSHDRNLKELEQKLRLDADRRLKVFELKASQYEAYVTNLDAFGRKRQVDMPARMQRIFDKYLKDYLDASEAEDKSKENEVIVWFGTQISLFMQEGLEDVLKLKAESNCLKLTATEEMLETFSELEILTQESMDTANEFMNKFTEIVKNQQNHVSQAYQIRLSEIDTSTKVAAQKLMLQMRAELNEI